MNENERITRMSSVLVVLVGFSSLLIAPTASADHMCEDGDPTCDVEAIAIFAIEEVLHRVNCVLGLLQGNDVCV